MRLGRSMSCNLACSFFGATGVAVGALATLLVAEFSPPQVLQKTVAVAAPSQLRPNELLPHPAPIRLRRGSMNIDYMTIPNSLVAMLTTAQLVLEVTITDAPLVRIRDARDGPGEAGYPAHVDSVIAARFGVTVSTDVTITRPIDLRLQPDGIDLVDDGYAPFAQRQRLVVFAARRGGSASEGRPEVDVLYIVGGPDGVFWERDDGLSAYGTSLFAQRFDRKPLERLKAALARSTWPQYRRWSE